jgi:hypothetical protein
MGAGNCLQIILRVPVGIEDYHYSRGGQVDTQATCTGGQQENTEIVFL